MDESMQEVEKPQQHRLEPYLQEKRDEIAWALADQGYTQAQIAKIFNVPTMTVTRIMRRRPDDWKPKWVKQG